jgi:hypothetical protein
VLIIKHNKGIELHWSRTKNLVLEKKILQGSIFYAIRHTTISPSTTLKPYLYGLYSRGASGAGCDITTAAMKNRLRLYPLKKYSGIFS